MIDFCYEKYMSRYLFLVHENFDDCLNFTSTLRTGCFVVFQLLCTALTISSMHSSTMEKTPITIVLFETNLTSKASILIRLLNFLSLKKYTVIIFERGWLLAALLVRPSKGRMRRMRRRRTVLNNIKFQ